MIGRLAVATRCYGIWPVLVHVDTGSLLVGLLILRSGKPVCIYSKPLFQLLISKTHESVRLNTFDHVEHVARPVSVRVACSSGYKRVLTMDVAYCVT